MIKDVHAGVGFPLLSGKPKHLKILSILYLRHFLRFCAVSGRELERRDASVIYSRLGV